MSMVCAESIAKSTHATAAHYQRMASNGKAIAEREKTIAADELSRLRAEYASAPTVELMLQMIRAFDYDEAAVILALHNHEDKSSVARVVRFVLAPMFENSLERLAAANAKQLALVELEALEALDGTPS